jgi:hypothetical protein
VTRKELNEKLALMLQKLEDVAVVINQPVEDEK